MESVYSNSLGATFPNARREKNLSPEMGWIHSPSEGLEMNRTEKLIFLGVLLCFFTQQSIAANPLDDWHWQNPRPQGNSLFGVGFGAGRFIAVGTSGTIIQSTNGVDWAVIKNP